MSRMAAIEAEYEKTQRSGGGKFDYVNVRALEREGIKYLKIEPGNNFWRIISPKFSKFDANNLPFYGREVFIHQNIGTDRRTFICMRKTKNTDGQSMGRCPVCEYYDQIQAADPNDKRLEELYAACRYVFFVYNVKDQTTEAQGLHWVDAPKRVKDGIINASVDKRTGQKVDVSDPVNGADVYFTRVGTKRNTTYEAFELNRTNGQPPAEWFQNVPDEFDSYLLWPRYETVYAEVFGGAPGTAPTRQSAPSPVSETGSVVDPDPAPAPVATPDPAPAPVATPDPAPVPAPASTTGAATRSRGGATSASPVIDPDVQARINQLKNGGA